MTNLSGCQIPCLPKVSEGNISFEHLSVKVWIKRVFAKPWNYSVKKYLKRFQKFRSRYNTNLNTPNKSAIIKDLSGSSSKLTSGDWVRVRSKEEIQVTLDNWNELRGCAFLADMWQYCGTTQKVLQSMERFLDERDYKVKKCKGIILLDGVMCQGTPVFGRCDRRCHFFWREEWLEKIPQQDILKGDN